MTYKKGYKYKTTEEFRRPVLDAPNTSVEPWVRIYDGTLTIAAGYAWDGASGPAIDTKNIMTPSLVHDALYQLMREGRLPLSYRKQADGILYDMCRNRGMSWLRANWIYLAVRVFGNYCLRHDAKPRTAP